MKKIAILLNTSWYIYNFRRNLIQELISNNFKVFAIAPYDEYSDKIKELGCEYYNIQFDSKSKNPIADIKLMFDIRKRLKNIKPDILLNFTIKPNIYGTLVARTLKIPCINNVAGFGTLFSENLISRTFFKALFKISQKKARIVFFQNPDDFEELTKSGVIDLKKADLLPGSGVNLNEFAYVPVTNNRNIIFLLIARMIYPKGIQELAQAAKKLKEKGFKNFEVHLLGEMNVNNPLAIHKEELDEICNNQYITYLGKTDDVNSEIQKSDVVVLPSYYREGTPKSLLEALAVGRPIITTDMPGCKETVVNNVNGFICEPKSVDDLFLKMEKFIKMDFFERRNMGEQSRKLAEEKFDESIVLRKYLDAMNETMLD